MSADLYLTLVLLLGACVLFALIYISYWLRILAKKDWKFEIENNINNNFTTALTGQQIRELVGNNPLILKDEVTGRVEVL